MEIEDQELLFSIFHDGTIFKIRTNENGYLFSVDIQYLAERIKPEFNFFNIQLIQMEEFSFEYSELNNIIGDIDKIDKLELEILKTDLKDNKIRIFCSEGRNNNFGYLNIVTKDIQVYDQENNLVELIKLEKIAREYWNKFGEKKTD